MRVVNVQAVRNSVDVRGMVRWSLAGDIAASTLTRSQQQQQQQRQQRRCSVTNNQVVIADARVRCPLRTARFSELQITDYVWVSTV